MSIKTVTSKHFVIKNLPWNQSLSHILNCNCEIIVIPTVHDAQLPNWVCTMSGNISVFSDMIPVKIVHGVHAAEKNARESPHVRKSNEM